MIPAVAWITRHLSTDLLERPAIEMKLFQKLAQAIITAFEFTHYIGRDLEPMFHKHILHVVHVVEVHDKPTHLFRNLGLGFVNRIHDLGDKLPDGCEFSRDSLEIDFWLMIVCHKLLSMTVSGLEPPAPVTARACHAPWHSPSTARVPPLA